MCCPRDCVSRHNGGASGASIKPLRVDSALRALSTLRGLREAPEAPPLCRVMQSLGQHMLELSCENATVGTNGLSTIADAFLVKELYGLGSLTYLLHLISVAITIYLLDFHIKPLNRISY